MREKKGLEGGARVKSPRGIKGKVEEKKKKGGYWAIDRGRLKLDSKIKTV